MTHWKIGDLAFCNCKQHPYNLDEISGEYSAPNLELLRISTKSVQCLEVLNHIGEILRIFFVTQILREINLENLENLKRLILPFWGL